MTYVKINTFCLSKHKTKMEQYAGDGTDLEGLLIRQLNIPWWP